MSATTLTGKHMTTRQAGLGWGELEGNKCFSSVRGVRQGRETLVTSRTQTSPGRTSGASQRMAGIGLVKCLLHLLDTDALLVVGSLVLGQDAQEWPQLEPPLLLGDAPLPVCVALQLSHRLEPVKGSDLVFLWLVYFPYIDKLWTQFVF